VLRLGPSTTRSFTRLVHLHSRPHIVLFFIHLFFSHTKLECFIVVDLSFFSIQSCGKHSSCLVPTHPRRRHWRAEAVHWPSSCILPPPSPIHYLRTCKPLIDRLLVRNEDVQGMICSCCFLSIPSHVDVLPAHRSRRVRAVRTFGIAPRFNPTRNTACSLLLTTSLCSKEDEDVLKAEYQKNPKPDKASRIEIVSKVTLGEKEVQVCPVVFFHVTSHVRACND
jgi:hypothetical protein